MMRTSILSIAIGALASTVIMSADLWAQAKNASPATLSYAEAPILSSPHQYAVQALAFSPDDKTLATGDGHLRLWDVASGRLKSTHADDASRGINGIAFSPDGRTVATVGGGIL